MGSIETKGIDQSVIAEAEQLLANLKKHDGTPGDQARVVRQLEKLRCSVHDGFDALLYHAQPFQILPAINTLIEHGVFDAVPIKGEITIADLANKVNIDPTILTRFINILLTQSLFNQPTPTTLSHTPASAIFRSDQAADFYRTTQFPQWYRVSSYLKSHPSTDAYNPTRVPYVWALGKEGKTYYEAMEEDAVTAEAWHKGMVMIESMQPVGGMFPFARRWGEVEGEGGGRVFVVDVGGGRGNALVAVMGECGGEVKGRLVLQDMKEVLGGSDPVRIDGVEGMAHDFFREQPVKNAHLYYLRNVLHNHYDDRGKIILQRIVDAMGSDSRVLIGEMILPSSAAAGEDPMPYFMDLNMFMEGGLERTEEQWNALLDSAGLRIEKIWRLASNPVQATIEARLK